MQGVKGAEHNLPVPVIKAATWPSEETFLRGNLKFDV